MPRPPATAPRGRLTLTQLADATGLSYSYLHRLALSKRIPAKQDASGVWTVTDAAARKIQRRPPADTDRKAVMLRPGLARYRAWEQAARGKPVSTWLGQLADAASGWTGGGVRWAASSSSTPSTARTAS